MLDLATRWMHITWEAAALREVSSGSHVASSLDMELGVLVFTALEPWTKTGHVKIVIPSHILFSMLTS